METVNTMVVAKGQEGTHSPKSLGMKPMPTEWGRG